MKYIFNWNKETLRIWGVDTQDEWIAIEGTLLECMNDATTQCDNVTFKMEEHGNDKSRFIVLVSGIPSGIIRPQ